jgi:hypothetical protein
MAARVREGRYRLGVDTGLEAEGPHDGLAHPEAWLLRALVYADELAGLVSHDDIEEALRSYMVCAADGPVSPLLLLAHARLAGRRGDTPAALGLALLRSFQERSPSLAAAWLAAADTALLEDDHPDVGKDDADDDEGGGGGGGGGEAPGSPLEQRWQRLQTHITEAQREPMEQLMAMVGLRLVKEKGHGRLRERAQRQAAQGEGVRQGRDLADPEFRLRGKSGHGQDDRGAHLRQTPLPGWRARRAQVRGADGKRGPAHGT